MVCGTGQSAEARALLGPGVDTVERDLDDAWMRDVGPTFLTDGRGPLAAVDWVFNGWGAQEWARWEHDAKIAAYVSDLAGARTYASRLVNEGGGIHVDGEGTVLLTETVQLGPERNPGWTKERVEAEIHAHLGTRKAIWLPRGLTGDYPPHGFGTLGHVDIVAAFARPGPDGSRRGGGRARRRLRDRRPGVRGLADGVDERRRPLRRPRARRGRPGAGGANGLRDVSARRPCRAPTARILRRTVSTGADCARLPPCSRSPRLLAAGAPVRSDRTYDTVRADTVVLDPRADLSHPRGVFLFPGPPTAGNRA
ncbi:hypothetical protein GCM10019016_065520 [Streptomyces prasinosporus]|uniref:Agmatine deiminase n=1 Tax=Streptomyces prasinosporus TaxID=68256 RepID=A0ABP6TXG3_9ACTN